MTEKEERLLTVLALCELTKFMEERAFRKIMSEPPHFFQEEKEEVEDNDNLYQE
jgi:hypothetical protein